MKTFRRWVNHFSSCSLLLVCGFAMNAAAQVNNYYATATGTGTTCSQTSPCNINQAISGATIAAGGAVVHARAGAYTGTCSSSEGSTGICIKRGGTSNTARLVIQCDGASFGTAVPDAYSAQGQCKISGQNAGAVMDAGSFVDLVGFDIGNTPGMITGVFGINGSTGSSFHIIGNYVHDLGSTVDTGQGGPGCPGFGEVITANGNHTDYQISRNIIVRYGVNGGAPSNGTCNVSHNIYSAANSIIENNIVANAPSSNLQIYQNPCNVTVANNVFLSSVRGMIIDGGGCATPGNITVINNYFGNHSPNDGRIGSISVGGPICTANTPTFFGHNISDGSSADFPHPLTSCDTVSPTTGGLQPSFVHQAPTSFFVNYRSDGSGDYHLGANSLGLGGGTTNCHGGSSACVPSTDFTKASMSSPPPVGSYSPATDTGNLPNAPTNLTAVIQ